MTPTISKQHEHFHRLLEQFKVAMLVTHAGNGKLRARPMALAKVESDGQLWFITDSETAKAHEIETESDVQVVCQNDRSTYLSLQGRASLIHDREKIEELWQEPFKVWFPKGKEEPNLALISVEPIEGEFWDTQGLKKISYLFEAAKAYATGTTPNIEEGEQHGRLQF
ncbi:MAG: class probable F420-dependent enzyme [Chthoniobacteraceae bacterium]|nr:class probable F420-dependent enzyme [Chthoniobacteraceae bacterium]